MENWVIFLLGLILGIPLSIFANVATPYVISYLKNSSLSRRERKTHVIVGEYRRWREYKEDPIMLALVSIRTLALGIGMVGILAYFSIYSNNNFFADFLIPILNPFLFGIFVGVITFVAAVYRAIENVRHFGKFEKKTLNQLQKLGYSAEEAKELMNKKEETA